MRTADAELARLRRHSLMTNYDVDCVSILVRVVGTVGRCVVVGECAGGRGERESVLEL
jgi:hypothetical protein